MSSQVFNTVSFSTPKATSSFTGLGWLVTQSLEFFSPDLGVLVNSPVTHYSDGLGLATTAPFNGFLRIFSEFGRLFNHSPTLL